MKISMTSQLQYPNRLHAKAWEVKLNLHVCWAAAVEYKEI